MSFKNKIEEAMDSAIQSSLNLQEATLKVGNFTGKIADKAGFKMKKVGDANPGADVIFTGDEKAIISYARKYLGAEEGQSLSSIQRDVTGGPGSQFENVEEAKKEDMDPVGKGDDDIDNDGDVDSSDEYLKNRRKKIGKSIDSAKLKEMAKASK